MISLERNAKDICVIVLKLIKLSLNKLVIGIYLTCDNFRDVWVKQYQNEHVEICNSPRLLAFSKILLISILLKIFSESLST